MSLVPFYIVIALVLSFILFCFFMICFLFVCMVVGVYRKIWAFKAAKGHAGAAEKFERIKNGPIAGNKFALFAALVLWVVCVFIINIISLLYLICYVLPLFLD